MRARPSGPQSRGLAARAGLGRLAPELARLRRARSLGLQASAPASVARVSTRSASLSEPAATHESRPEPAFSRCRWQVSTARSSPRFPPRPPSSSSARASTMAPVRAEVASRRARPANCLLTARLRSRLLRCPSAVRAPFLNERPQPPRRYYPMRNALDGGARPARFCDELCVSRPARRPRSASSLLSRPGRDRATPVNRAVVCRIARASAAAPRRSAPRLRSSAVRSRLKRSRSC